MIEAKLDSNTIETTLYYAIKASGYLGNIYCGDRPSAVDDMNDFIVIKMNGSTNPVIASDEVVSARRVCLIQIWAKDLGSSGMKNMSKLTEIRSQVLSVLPFKNNSYKFSYKNEVGQRDRLGFHAEYINLDCLIY